MLGNWNRDGRQHERLVQQGHGDHLECSLPLAESEDEDEGVSRGWK